jgi:hypothetical protein
MKHLRSLTLLFAVILFALACNDDADKAADTSDTTAAATVDTTTTTPAEPATTSANILIGRHKVKDFAKWKTSYDAHDSLRQVNGIHSFVIGRGIGDTNMVLVATKVDDVAKAKEFSKSTHLKEAMQKGGVVGTPKMMLTNVPVLRTNSSSDLRVMSILTVKDWDAWKARYEDGKQFRADNGLEDRGYGHDVDDNKKVIVVVTVLDSAKAVGYYKSDSLKKRMERSGVVGTPDRFWYRVVQTY